MLALVKPFRTLFRKSFGFHFILNFLRSVTNGCYPIWRNGEGEVNNLEKPTFKWLSCVYVDWSSVSIVRSYIAHIRQALPVYWVPPSWFVNNSFIFHVNAANTEIVLQKSFTVQFTFTAPKDLKHDVGVAFIEKGIFTFKILPKITILTWL